MARRCVMLGAGRSPQVILKKGARLSADDPMFEGDQPLGMTWCAIDSAALEANMRSFRRSVRPETRLAAVVKANAYGHGLLLAARAFLRGGADWLCVHSLAEARALREGGVEAAILVIGPVALDALAEAAALQLRLVVYNAQTVARLAALGCAVRVHLKIETGNHRQGLELSQALALAAQIAEHPHIELEGVSTHFANIEDTTDHRYARAQVRRFEAGVAALRAAGHAVPIRHIANSAATILWPEKHLELVRVGLAAYGLWPSPETYLAAQWLGRAQIDLHPALRWCARVAQIKTVPKGSAIGYGCSFMTTHETRLAIVPVGYSDGYDRALGNVAHVLIGGQRAPVRGRVCMNILMAEITDIPGVQLEDEVVLLGGQGRAQITAEQLAQWAGTINYEVVSRIAAHLPRVEAPQPVVAHENHSYRAPFQGLKFSGETPPD